MKQASPIKIKRITAGLSQYEIPGVHQARMTLVERGLSKPSRKEALAIAKALKSDPKEIFPEMFN